MGDLASGLICGHYSDIDGAVELCKGNHPRWSCPASFHQRAYCAEQWHGGCVNWDWQCIAN